MAREKASNLKKANCQAMGLFKPDFYRSFIVGFAVGAVIVLASLGINPGQDIAKGVVPAAEAAPAR